MGKFYVKLVNFPSHKLPVGSTWDAYWGGSIWLVMREYVNQWGYTQANVVVPDNIVSDRLKDGAMLTFDFEKTVAAMRSDNMDFTRVRVEFSDNVWDNQSSIKTTGTSFTPVEGKTYSFDVQTGVTTLQPEVPVPEPEPTPLPGPACTLDMECPAGYVCLNGVCVELVAEPMPTPEPTPEPIPAPEPSPAPTPATSPDGQGNSAAAVIALIAIMAFAFILSKRS